MECLIYTMLDLSFRKKKSDVSFRNDRAYADYVLLVDIESHEPSLATR